MQEYTSTTVELNTKNWGKLKFMRDAWTDNCDKYTLQNPLFSTS
jgi:hypothetical protein